MMIFVYEIIESKMILTIQPEIPEIRKLSDPKSGSDRHEQVRAEAHDLQMISGLSAEGAPENADRCNGRFIRRLL